MTAGHAKSPGWRQTAPRTQPQRSMGPHGGRHSLDASARSTRARARGVPEHLIEGLALYLAHGIPVRHGTMGIYRTRHMNGTCRMRRRTRMTTALDSRRWATEVKIAVEQWRTALENIISMVGQSTPKPQCVDLLGVVNVARTALSVTCPPEATCNSCTHLRVALSELLAVIAADDLIPESVSYMRQARAALAPGEPALTDRVACCGRLPHGRT
jgi:hypothetical protein